MSAVQRIKSSCYVAPALCSQCARPLRTITDTHRNMCVYICPKHTAKKNETCMCYTTGCNGLKQRVEALTGWRLRLKLTGDRVVENGGNPQCFHLIARGLWCCARGESPPRGNVTLPDHCTLDCFSSFRSDHSFLFAYFPRLLSVASCSCFFLSFFFFLSYFPRVISLSSWLSALTNPRSQQEVG